MAKTHSEEVRRSVSNYITYAESLEPTVTGRDIKTLGIKEGPVYGEILEALKKAKIDEGIATKAEELAFVRRFIRERDGLEMNNGSGKVS